MESTIVPDILKPKYETVSEALLDLDEKEISHLHLNAPILCTSQRILVPVTFITALKEGDHIGIRENLLDEIFKSEKSSRAENLESLFPPEGSVGFWDVDERIYRTRYMKNSVLDRPRTSQDLAKKRNWKDPLSYWMDVLKGEIIPFIDTSIELVPPNSENPLAFEFTYPGNSSKWKLSIAFRGCAQFYEYPFRASAFRQFSDGESAQPFDALKKFVQNLIVELAWCRHQIALYPYQSESIVQHYKILPWTYLTDVSYDINIAKAFACSPEPHSKTHTPVLYKVVLLNADYYDIGASFLERLPFQRPKSQKAMSLIGLNGTMQDPTGIVVALTEHPFYYDHKGTSWDTFGGSSFAINGTSFNSLSLKDDEYQRLQSLLYPQEPEQVKDFFATIIGKTRKAIEHFGLSNSDKQDVLNRFVGLEKELVLVEGQKAA